MKLNEVKRNNCQSEGVYGETFFPLPLQSLSQSLQSKMKCRRKEIAAKKE